jgi:peptidoglycan/LPS O-acetylase OafA/YrhL
VSLILGRPALAHLGNHGVTLFFAISGFRITTLLLRENSSE